jgi:hypothetical protein
MNELLNFIFFSEAVLTEPGLTIDVILAKFER